LKSQFLFFSDILEFQVGGPVNQQIKNMWPKDWNSEIAWNEKLMVLSESALQEISENVWNEKLMDRYHQKVLLKRFPKNGHVSVFQQS
jgi:hypothetical protein